MRTFVLEVMEGLGEGHVAVIASIQGTVVIMNGRARWVIPPLRCVSNCPHFEECPLF